MASSDTPTLPDIRIQGFALCNHLVMATRRVDRRRTERSHGVMFRLSREDRDLLRQRAADYGVSVQTYLERVALGRPDVTDLRPGPAPADGQKELPLTSG